jgi:hypothetical protein
MGRQPAGDPAAAAQALLKIVDSDNPPPRAHGHHRRTLGVTAKSDERTIVIS